eukprot:TRINITY_DN16355_c0_g1_i2.p1 TRINITY_DN16355_c0_g1~~TRINITY_DN16355_c0_g1_i2.p1  ORF type:complete len:320 (+),score=42.43 TRINITY_DN16355_c0_g1_i2:69-962(+)
MALGPPRRLDNAEILRVMAGAGVRHFGDAAAPPQRLPPQPSSGLARQDGVGATADGLERRSSAVSSRFRSTAGSSGGEALFAALPRSTGRATNPYLSLPGAAHAPNAHLPFARPPSRVPVTPLAPHVPVTAGAVLGRRAAAPCRDPAAAPSTLVADAAAAGLKVDTAPPWLGSADAGEGAERRRRSPRRTHSGDTAPPLSASVAADAVEEVTAGAPGHAGWRCNARERLPNSGPPPAQPCAVENTSPASPMSADSARHGHKTLNAIIQHGNDLVLDRARALSDSILQRHERVNALLA